jgi:hypothetical protein
MRIECASMCELSDYCGQLTSKRWQLLTICKRF